MPPEIMYVGYILPLPCPFSLNIFELIDPAICPSPPVADKPFANEGSSEALGGGGKSLLPSSSPSTFVHLFLSGSHTICNSQEAIFIGKFQLQFNMKACVLIKH